MIGSRVSVVIPACNEYFLQATIESLLIGATGDVEIIAVLDGGPWPVSPVDRFLQAGHVIVIRHNTMLGMRRSFNEALEIATGEYVMKCDAHCLFAPGWDAALKADCADTWLVVPTRHAIDGRAWKTNPGQPEAAIRERHYNYHYLTWPFNVSMYGYGLHAKTFDARVNKQLNERWRDRSLDDLMSFQGSCWFMPIAWCRHLWPNGLDQEHYYFYQEAQELGLTVWMRGGRCVVNKRTWYAHYHKGPNNLHTYDGREGRGFFLNLHRKRESEQYAADLWLNDRLPGAVLTFRAFIERFWPLLAELNGPDRWPEDWRDFTRHRAAFLTRPADQVPAHLA